MGGAGVPEHTLRAAFASGPNGALMVAGLAGITAAALVLIRVRTPLPAPGAASGAVRQEVEAVPPRG